MRHMDQLLLGMHIVAQGAICQALLSDLCGVPVALCTVVMCSTTKQQRTLVCMVRTPHPLQARAHMWQQVKPFTAALVMRVNTLIILALQVLSMLNASTQPISAQPVL